MKANETTFQHVIEGTKQYIVPLFQRPYCWDKSQWETLWNDLVEMQDVVSSSIALHRLHRHASDSVSARRRAEVPVDRRTAAADDDLHPADLAPRYRTPRRPSRARR